MELILRRIHDNGQDTIGILTELSEKREHFLCFTLEDQYRAVKVHGDTRIPAGKYAVQLRTVGDKTVEYAKRFGLMHKGMLELCKVPGFDAILIHTGNRDRDTEGCVLVGDVLQRDTDTQRQVLQSTVAYKRIYPLIAAMLVAKKTVTIDVKDEPIVVSGGANHYYDTFEERI